MSTPTREPDVRRSWRRRLMDRLTATEFDDEAAELRRDSRDAGAETIMGCPRGVPVTVAGTLRSVTLRPTAGVPQLEAELYDGTGRLTLVWLGRRRIAGIEPGRGLVASGRITCHTDVPVLYNPKYTLKPTAGE